MSDGAASVGSKLQVETNTPGTYATVARVLNLNGPQGSTGELDFSGLDNTDFVKEFLPGWIDGGSVSGEWHFTKVTYGDMVSLRNARAVKNWKIVFSEGSELGFAGFISALATNLQPEQTIRMPMTIRVTGLPSFTAAA